MSYLKAKLRHCWLVPYGTSWVKVLIERFTFLATLLCLSSASVGGEPLAKAELLKVLRHAERTIQNFRFSLELKRFAISEDGRELPLKYTVECRGVITTAQEPFFNVHTRATLMSVEGNRLVDTGDPVQYQASYNGAYGMELYYDSSTQEKPKSGLISREPNLNNTMVMGSGLEILLPFFRPLGGASLSPLRQPRGLVHYLENLPTEWGDWRVEETDSPDIVRIVILYEDQRPSDVVDIDLSKGASIVRYAFWPDYGTPRAAAVGRCHRMDNVVLEEYGGVWLPVSFVRYYPRHLSRVTIQYDGVNESLDESDFVLDFPLGVQVVHMIGVPKLVGKEAPALDVVKWASGKPTTLAALRGKTVVVAFWDNTSDVCAELALLLNGLLNKYSEEDVGIISVHSSDTEPGILKQFISANSIKFRVALDKPAEGYKGATFQKYIVEEVPAVFIIDTEGKLRYQDIPVEAVEEAAKSILDEQ